MGVTDIAYTPESRAKLPGLEIAWDAFGRPSDPPLVLIAGLASQLIQWPEAFCADLARRGLRVIRFDNRDTGHSTCFDRLGIPNMQAVTRALAQGGPPPVPYTLEDMATDTLGLLDALKIDTAHIAGVSLGGRIAQIVALRQPQRILTLTAIMSSMGEPGHAPPDPAALDALLEPAPSDREGYIAYFVRLTRVLAGRHLPPDDGGVRRHAARAYDRRFNPAGVARQYAALMATPGARVQLAQLQVPTLVIHGREDPLIPVDAAREMAAVIPGAQLLLVEGMGHALADVPGLWAQVVDVIVRHALGA